MTEAERLYQIHAYLDCIERHAALLPEKTTPDELDLLARRFESLWIRTRMDAAYSRERRQDAAEARERVSQMIGTVN